ncbi:MAG TPA: preprotein translocase subunit YajC [Clostridiales bacterium]|nr:preprotein translocase subunit YajC [Clostridiales bacterium]
MSPLISLLLYVILFGAIMYFFMIMPQKKRERKAKEMISNLKLNARVVTIGGIFGKIVDVQEDEVTIETGIEKAKVTMKKWAVREVLSDDQA